MSGSEVRVYASGDALTAELMKGRLETEGIPVLLKGDGEGPYRAGVVYLWVSEEFEDKARAVVRAVEAGEFALEDDAYEDVETDLDAGVAQEDGS
jgi:hypothetical protein